MAAALAYSRRVSAAIVAHAASEARNLRPDERRGGLVEQRAQYFHRHIAHLALAARGGTEPDAVLGREGFEIAQWATNSAAAAALHQMAARVASGSGELAAAVREIQDVTGFARVLDRKLLASLANPHGHHDRAPIEILRQQMGRVESRIAALSAQIEKEFPEYAVLAAPRPLTVEEVQSLLSFDEAMLFWLAGDKESYVFALTRDGFAWRTIALGARELAARIAAFRRGLDINEFDASVARGKPLLFDLTHAHDLYDALVAPVEPPVRGRRHLLLGPSGPLTALPFHLLVTAKPAVGVPAQFAGYREVAWLATRHSTAVLPAIASLKALRVFARKRQGTKPMIGFGDPVFGPETPAAPSAPAVSSQTRGYGDFWQGVSVDRAKLAQALPRLTATADELRSIAQKLGAPSSDIHLRRAASETTLKGVRLIDYRVVYFATHGLVAGDVKDLAEPSLALTIPQQPSQVDDGLLTASEIAQLKLNADWVVLSACNTIAGDKPGAEALSGLARAFFYAGARALLVSHWAVDSAAATRLTIAAFDIMKREPAVGRAEALRRAMLTYMNAPSNPRNAYPAYWAPFVVLGDGAAR
jgi:CHAT domain-containing protein